MGRRYSPKTREPHKREERNFMCGEREGNLSLFPLSKEDKVFKGHRLEKVALERRMEQREQWDG